MPSRPPLPGASIPHWGIYPRGLPQRQSNQNTGAPHGTRPLNLTTVWMAEAGRAPCAPSPAKRTTATFRPACLCGALVIIGWLFPLTSWSGSSAGHQETSVINEPVSMPVVPAKPRRIVAAGVGFQNDGASTITVKTYDADSGLTLSEETYELNVKEDAGPSAETVRERIFAGGVGPSANGLSEFLLRVYDASTGRFLWEGQLNLSPSPESGTAHQVIAHVSPQTIVTNVRRRAATDGQPEFLLRAVDPATGHLVWADQFSARQSICTCGADRPIGGRTDCIHLRAPRGISIFESGCWTIRSGMSFGKTVSLPPWRMLKRLLVRTIMSKCYPVGSRSVVRRRLRVSCKSEIHPSSALALPLLFL